MSPTCLVDEHSALPDRTVCRFRRSNCQPSAVEHFRWQQHGSGTGLIDVIQYVRCCGGTSWTGCTLHQQKYQSSCCWSASVVPMVLGWGICGPFSVINITYSTCWAVICDRLAQKVCSWQRMTSDALLYQLAITGDVQLVQTVSEIYSSHARTTSHNTEFHTFWSSSGILPLIL